MDLIKLFVCRPNQIEHPDGRPFYAYDIPESTLQRFEEALAQPNCTDETRVQLLAFVAAERFRRVYRDGPWSWDDCGTAVSKLRENRGTIAFSRLIARSLKYWGLTLLKLHQRSLYLSSIVTYGGFPVGFLSGQSPLRAVLRQLLRKRMSHGRSELQRATEVQIPASNLPDAFKASPSFSDLCVKLIDAVADLVELAGGKSLQVDTLDEKFPGWKKTLPLSFDGDDAQHLIIELLNLASESFGSTSNELKICRFVLKAGHIWVLSTRIEDLPSRITLPDGCTAPMYRLQVLANGEPVRELTRLAKQSDGHYVSYPRPRPNELLLEPPFDHPSISFGMQVLTGEICEALGTEGGEPLDAGIPWVFVVSDDASLSMDGITRCELIGTGSTRTRHSRVVVAVQSGWKITADAPKILGELRVEGDELVRQLIEIDGDAVIEAGDNGEFTIRCNALSNGPHLKLSGRYANVASSCTRQIFRGAPRVSVEPTGEGMVIQWRSVGDGHQKTWSQTTGMAKGLVRYRLSDDEGTVAEARALVLPDTFKVQSTTTALNVTLDAGWRIAAPKEAEQHDAIWRVPLPPKHELPGIDLLITTPFATPPIVLRAPVFRLGTGFRRLLDNKSAPGRLSIAQLSEYVAYSNAASTCLWLSLNGPAGFPYRLRASAGSQGSRLPLAFISGDLQELRYSSTEIDVPMSLSFAGQQAITVSPPRLIRSSDVIYLQQDQSYQGAIRLRHMSLDCGCVLEPDADNPQSWRLPVDFPSGWSIATAAEKGVRPLAVRLGEEEMLSESGARSLEQLIQVNGNSSERMIRFGRHLSDVLDHASMETSGEELAYLQQWLMRFDDVPAEYLDLLKSIANVPADAIRMLAYYHGSAVFESLRATLTRIPLYWHLSSRHAWNAFLPWWIDLVGSNHHDLIEIVTQSLADTQLEAMDLDADIAGIYGAFLIEKIKGGVSKTPQYRAFFEGGFHKAKRQWRNQIATLVEDFHGATFPMLNAVDAVVKRLTSQSRLDVGFDVAYDWILPVLRAPLAAAWIAHGGVDVTDELRRQLAYARHLGPSEFDRLYANSAMLLEQMQ